MDPYVSPLLVDLEAPMYELGYRFDPETGRWELSAETLQPSEVSSG